MNTTTHQKSQRMTTLALLSAIIIILTIICTFIKFGPFSITLALTPIIIGAAIYGWKSGCILGFVFGLTVLITGIIGWDGGFVLMMMQYSAVGTVLVCLLKGVAAGAAAGGIYKAVEKKNGFAAALLSGAAAPIVNTGLFALAMMTIFNGFLANNVPSDSSPISVLFLSWIGINFIVELITNIALSTATNRIIKLISHK